MGFDITQFKVPNGVDTDVFKNVVGAAYTAYIGNRGVRPTVEEVAKYCTHLKATVAKVMDTPEFEFAIKARGCTNWDGSSGLTSKQQLALSVLTNPTDRRPIDKKLRSVGANYSEYTAWLKQPLFRKHVDKITEEMLGENIGNVHTALVQKATGGDTRAIQLFYELTGRHDPASKQVAEMRVIIQMLLEIITRNVTDPKALENISNEINAQVLPKMITGTVVQ